MSFCCTQLLGQQRQSAFDFCRQLSVMLATVKVSTVPVGFNLLENKDVLILATSAAAVSTETTALTPHRYLDDFKPFATVFGFKNVSLQLTKAVILPLNILLNEFNLYMDQYKDTDPDDIPPYDWNTAFTKFYRSVAYDGTRFLMTSVIRKALEEYSLHNFSMKVTDQFTKDIAKSLIRKDARFGVEQRMEVCRRMFFTTGRATSLTYLSFFIYDSAYVTIQHIVKAYNALIHDGKSVGEALVALDLPSLLWKITKKLIFQTTSLTSQSLGYAVGSYFNLKYGGLVGGTIFELLASLMLSQFISTNDEPVKPTKAVSKTR